MKTSLCGLLDSIGTRLMLLVVIAVALPLVCFAQSLYSDSTDAKPQPGERVWLGADGKPLPFTSEDEVLDFLRTAQVRDVSNIPVGITKPRRVRLEKDGLQACAIFHYRHFVGTNEELEDGEKILFFRESYLNQVAAYELNRLLGMRRVPPTVLRKVDGKKGSVQFWIENACNERDRSESDLQPTDPSAIVLANHDMRVFDNLINNIDRNWTNILYDSDWNLWYIDHTRAFGRDGELRDTKRLQRICRPLWENLQSLDDSLVFKTLKPYMGKMEMKRLLDRRDKIIKHFQEKIAKEGEDEVLFDYPNPAGPEEH